MPNYCGNTITLSNPDEKIVAGLIQQIELDGTFITYLCSPFKKRIQKKQRYDDCYLTVPIAATVSDCEIINKKKIGFNFESPWYPPIPFYEHLVAHGWSVKAYYEEGGQSICGRWHNGVDKLCKYDFSDEKSVMKIPKDIDDIWHIKDYYLDLKQRGDLDYDYD